MPATSQRSNSNFRLDHTSRQMPLLALSGLAPFILGCNGAPTLTIAGAYFPAWLICGLVAVLAAVVVWVVMIATGLSNRIPFQLAVCISLGVIAALILWRTWVLHG